MNFKGKWRKLHMIDPPEFDNLPLTTRAFASLLLRVVDDSGRLKLKVSELGFIESIVQTISWKLGATTADKRAMRAAFKELQLINYIVNENDDMIIPSFVDAQKSVTKTDTNSSEKRTENELKTKSASSLGNHSIDASRFKNRETRETNVPSLPNSSTDKVGNLGNVRKSPENTINIFSGNTSQVNQVGTTDNSSTPTVGANSSDNRSISLNSESKELKGSKTQTTEEKSTVESPGEIKDHSSEQVRTSEAKENPPTPFNALHIDDFILPCRKTSDNKLFKMVSVTAKRELMRIVLDGQLHPMDFSILGFAYSEGKVFSWLKETPTTVYLLKDEGKILLSAIEQARNYYDDYLDKNKSAENYEKIKKGLEECEIERCKWYGIKRIPEKQAIKEDNKKEQSKTYN